MSSSELLIHFLVSPQLDFIGLPGEFPGSSDDPESTQYPEVHIGEECARRLRGSGKPGDDPFVDFTLKLLERTSPEVRIVTDEDWHTPQSDEFITFGKHCLMGSSGAKLPERIEEKRWHEHFSYIRANSLNISTDPRFSDEMNRLVKNFPRNRIKVSLSGVYSHLKVDYLLLNLRTQEPIFDPKQIAVCEFLCASPEMDDHVAAMRKFSQMKISILQNQDEFEEWLGTPI